MRIRAIVENVAADRRRVRRVVSDWQHHRRDFFDTAYWSRRFAPFEELFARYRPGSPVRLYRSERTDIDNRYADRYSSWSRRPDSIRNFGWGERRLVTCVFGPRDILVDLAAAGLDTEGTDEVIVRPSACEPRPYRLVWDRRGFFNYYDDPERYDGQTRST